MKGLIKYKKNIFIVISLLLFFHTEIFADSIYSEELYVKSAYSNESISSSTSSTPTIVNSSKNIEVSLNSFGSISMMVMLILTSLLGAFFVRDEFSEVLD